MFAVLTIGTLKESYWRGAAAEYLKRMEPYLPIRVIEIPEVAFKSVDDKERVTKKEAEMLLKKIKPRSRVILLDPQKSTPTTAEFAKKFYAWKLESDVIFIIAGPLGAHQSLRDAADETLSLSPLTFTHQMTRVLLFEQLYRVIMREKGKYDY